ncbi:SRPBCC domain-containing protein [Paracoccus aurantiacus]|uniref:SRPBCC domain-containing protein n=1 Tax=Paracoccus aurantiacus TaxID=2599412 RepID=A0A5C6S7E2_9RHOB|nr:SRPBCC domain-containing protein [Paracoccus aurantiacus]TXB69981.1 SRPBCC domain-containing protein [Paracoccus aurantiacus]
MTDKRNAEADGSETRSVVIERSYPYPPDRLWRALTRPELLSEWLMQTDFTDAPGGQFRFTADWGGVDCTLLTFEPQHRLSYSWGDGTLDTIVTWTLTPTAAGTDLRMEQSGFRTDQPRYYGGAKAGWPQFFDNLETLLGTGRDL